MGARDERQRGLVPPERLEQVHALVVGVGAIGRQVSLQLASIGVPSMTLVDFDTIEEVNLGPQGWSAKDIGLAKVSVTGSQCLEKLPELVLDAREERFNEVCAHEIYGAKRRPRFCVFLCVDSMAVRKEIWEALRPYASFLVDGRMTAEVLRVLAVDDPAIDPYYHRTLFTDAEAFTGSCTARSTIYSANVAAGLMVGALAKWLRAFPNDRDVLFSLLTMEITKDVEGETPPLVQLIAASKQLTEIAL